jgi:8-oxo-dGTP pyrophosphatase MutT (NUDIX family)
MRLGLFKRWLMIVDRASANPGIAGVAVVPVDADHAEISRPATVNSVQFSSSRAFLEQVFAIPAWLARYPRQVAAVCYREGPRGVEFLLVRTTGGRWTFPKGRIETKRGLAGSAAQEALEEAGVTGVIHPEPVSHYLHAKRELKDSDERGTRFCVSAFPLKVVDERARAPERNRSPTWFSPNEAKTRLGEDRPVIYQQEFARVIDDVMRHISQADWKR